MNDETTCRTCGDNMLAKWIRMRQTEPRVELTWQLRWGVCIDCHRDRFAAVHEYARAADEVRLWMLLGAEPGGRGPNPPGGSELAAAMHRVQEANDRCVRLGIWPAERKFRRPHWYYGDERSNTE